MGLVVVPSTPGNLPSLLEWVPWRLMASVLLEEMKTVVPEANNNQLEETMGGSWAALTAEYNLRGRGIGTLLVEAGAGGGWEVWEEKRGRGGI